MNMIGIDYEFRNKDLLDKALSHTSTIGVDDYEFERLEFIGDRVLGLVIAEELLQKFPDYPEGKIVNLFAKLVSKEIVIKVAEDFNLKAHMHFSKKSAKTSRKYLETVLCDGCESLIGAIYLDGGLDVARQFILKHWTRYIQSDDTGFPYDVKNVLQQWTQSLSPPRLPEYRCISREGPDHSPNFVSEVSVKLDSGEVLIASSSGSSLKESEKNAAAEILKKLYEMGLLK